MTDPLSLKAVIFDFDGTIVDTETPVYEAWRQTFVYAGVEPVAFETWAAQIGQADADVFDVRAELCRRLGVAEVPPELDEHRRKLRDEMLYAEPVRDGVHEWIEAALERGVALAVASSSSSDWVRPNLARIGLSSQFSVVSCADPGIPGKPDPTVYALACEQLSIEAADAVAIEDSHHGVTAATSAGLRCVAAPGPITRGADFAHASIRVDSLAELDPHDWF